MMNKNVTNIFSKKNFCIKLVIKEMIKSMMNKNVTKIFSKKNLHKIGD